MWCTRWYLPLVLLPIPIAPPYFLLLFLCSTTMHARPCFYCMVLLTAMFMSTCYWPPIPIETPLVRPWSKDVNTFADALHAIMPDIPEDKFPDTLPVADRCWCDFSNGFFAPFNTTRWEELSVVRMKERLEKDMATELKAMEKKECQAATGGEDGSEAHGCDVTEAEEPKEAPISTLEEIWGRRTLLEILWNGFTAVRRKRSVEEPTSAPSPVITVESPTPEAAPTLSEGYHNTPQESKSSPIAPGTTPSSWFRREYDLRRFGFAMVLDFGWPGSHS